MAETAGFDEETAHYMSVAVRESVVNAIKHGHKGDEAKRVTVRSPRTATRWRCGSRTRAPGFDPSSVPDPLAEENLLKADGRGIFFMRQFMDEVAYSFPPRGGTVVKMTKRR